MMTKTEKTLLEKFKPGVELSFEVIHLGARSIGARDFKAIKALIRAGALEQVSLQSIPNGRYSNVVIRVRLK
jgi:hypothetical protein